MNRAALFLLLLGLVLTLVGAGVAAYGVILSEHNARALASMKWDFNQELYESLLFQSRCAMWGLIGVAFGTAMQFIGIVLQERYKTNTPASQKASATLQGHRRS